MIFIVWTKEGDKFKRPMRFDSISLAQDEANERIIYLGETVEIEEVLE